jgi:zinc protease
MKRTHAPIAGAVLALALFSADHAAAQSLKVPYQTFTLGNGLKVILHEDHSVPILSVNTWYHVGSSDEKPGRTGFAHLFEHIMFMGSQNVPTGDFDRLLEAAGASNNGSTTEDRTNYYEDGPSNALPLMMWLDSDRLGFLLPEISPEKVDIQRGVVKNERRQSYENRPYGLAEENILSRLYPEGHPYRWPVIGSMEDLSAASIDDVREFFKTYYTPNNATIVIAGDIQLATAKKLAETWFGDIPKGPEIKRSETPKFSLEKDVHGVLEDRVQLPRIYNAWHSTPNFAPDDAALTVLSQILAGGKTSRLYKRLVYELQIANQVTSYQDAGRRDGKFIVYATARPGHNLTELQTVIDQEMKKIAEAPPSAREMDRVLNAFEAEFVGSMESVGGFEGKANQLNHYNFYTGEPDYFEKDLARYRAVKAADVQRVAQQYVKNAKRVYLSVVPQGKTDLAVTSGGQP